jgi:hypothetical protein
VAQLFMRFAVAGARDAFVGVAVLPAVDSPGISGTKARFGLTGDAAGGGVALQSASAARHLDRAAARMTLRAVCCDLSTCLTGLTPIRLRTSRTSVSKPLTRSVC